MAVFAGCVRSSLKPSSLQIAVFVHVRTRFAKSPRCLHRALVGATAPPFADAHSNQPRSVCRFSPRKPDGRSLLAGPPAGVFLRLGSNVPTARFALPLTLRMHIDGASDLLHDSVDNGTYLRDTTLGHRRPDWRARTELFFWQTDKALAPPTPKTPLFWSLD
jgi:hypothetical protein